MDGQCFALLIDADNVSAKYIKPILTELSNMEISRTKNLWRLDEYATFKLEG